MYMNLHEEKILDIIGPFNLVEGALLEPIAEVRQIQMRKKAHIVRIINQWNKPYWEVVDATIF